MGSGERRKVWRMRVRVVVVRVGESSKLVGAGKGVKEGVDIGRRKVQSTASMDNHIISKKLVRMYRSREEDLKLLKIGTAYSE